MPLCYENEKQAVEIVCLLCGAEALEEVYLNMTSTRVIELILRILSLFRQNSITFHQKGGAAAVEALLKFQRMSALFDNKIVTFIMDILEMNEHREVAALLTSCITFLAASHLKKVLIAVSQHPTRINLEKFFLGIIAGREEEFLRVVIEIMDERFAFAVVPLIGKVVEKTDDMTYSKVFVSVSSCSEQLAQELFRLMSSRISSGEYRDTKSIQSRAFSVIATHSVQTQKQRLILQHLQKQL
jgi:hypothetical protein